MFILTVLAGVSQIRSLAGATEISPFVGAMASRMTRVRIALLLSVASHIHILEFQSGRVLHLGQHPFAIYQYIFRATDQKRLTVRQFPQIHVARYPSDVSSGKTGGTDIVVLVERDGIDGLFVIGRQHQMGRIDGNKHLLPAAIVQIRSDKHSFPLVQQTGVQIEPAS